MTLHDCLTLIAPGETCVFSMRLLKYSDGRTNKPIFTAVTNGRTLVSGSLAGLVEMAQRDRELLDEAGEVVGAAMELETATL